MVKWLVQCSPLIRHRPVCSANPNNYVGKLSPLIGDYKVVNDLVALGYRKFQDLCNIGLS